MVIVLLGIVSATAVVVIGNIISQQSFDATVKEMTDLKAATIGNPDLIEGGVRSNFGYAGDRGALPAAMSNLVTNPVACGFVSDSALGGGTNLGTGAGWRGPYIDNKQDDLLNYLALLDGWGRAYSYDAPTGRVGSWGPNAAFGGFATPDADDIIIPSSTIAGITGTVSGRVTNPSGGAIQAPPATNNVIIYGPPLTCPSTFTQYAGATDSNGAYTIANVPLGKHKLSVTVGATTVDKAVTVVPGATTNADVVFTSPLTTPSTPAGLVARAISTSNIQLTWNAVSTNTDGSSLRDKKGYNIYRGLAVNPTSLYATLPYTVTAGTVSYVDPLASYFNTYNYRVKTVNTSGTESAYSANVSAPGGYGTDPVLQTVSTSGFGTNTITFSIIVNQAITVTNMNVCWGGGPAQWNRININGGANELNIAKANCAVSTGVQFTDIALAAGSTNTVQIRFSANVNYTNNVYVRFLAGATTYQIGVAGTGLQ